MELEEAIKDLKNMIIKSRDLREEEFYKLITIHQIQSTATVLQALDNSVSKDIIRENIEATDNELEEKYSAEKISVFSGNTYMEKFKLIGKRQALQELL